jgi:hypothetical protein
MSGSPGPHGQIVGTFTCLTKANGNAVFTSPAGAGTIVLHLDDEDAEYFTVGQSYEFSATQP